VADDGGRGVAGVGVDEHAGDYSVAVEGLPVREVGVGLASVRGGVVPGEVRWRWGVGGGREMDILSTPPLGCALLGLRGRLARC
jgi:hypothetical protein